jgi:hypothetical protein
VRGDFIDFFLTWFLTGKYSCGREEETFGELFAFDVIRLFTSQELVHAFVIVFTSRISAFLELFAEEELTGA